MIAAAPEGSPPRRISNKQFKKNPARRASESPETGFDRIHYDFHDLGANTLIHACFCQSHFFILFLMKHDTPYL